MNKKIPMKVLSALSALIVIGTCQMAYAGLGESVDSVFVDQARLMAQRRSQSTASYTTHVMTLPTGTIVREYVSQGGQVFAVTWEGPVAPNLAQLLGSYSDKAGQEIRKYRESHPGFKGPLSLSSDDFVLQSGGRMRAYFGRAYIPSAMPSGVTPEDLR